MGDEIIVACRNFVPEGAELLEFERFMRRRYDSCDIGRVPTLGQIDDVLESDPILSHDSVDFKSAYWELFIGDALVGNFDRHMGNFGYLIFPDDSIRMSSVYDNGSTLFPTLSEEGMRAVLADPKEIMMRVRLFPNAALEMSDGKINYLDMMASGIREELSEAVIRKVPLIRGRMPKAMRFIDSCGFLSDIRKRFYKAMLAVRMEFILEDAFRICASGRFDEEAARRIFSGKPLSVRDFETWWGINRDVREKRLQRLLPAQCGKARTAKNPENRGPR